MDFYTLVSILALIGFLGLAALLLIPVYRFMKREEEASKRWTREALHERIQEKETSSNGQKKNEEEQK